MTLKLFAASCKTGSPLCRLPYLNLAGIRVPVSIKGHRLELALKVFNGENYHQSWMQVLCS